MPRLQHFASELVLSIFRGLFPNSGEVILDKCQNQSFRTSFAFEMPKRFWAISRTKVAFYIFFGGEGGENNFGTRIFVPRNGFFFEAGKGG